MNTFNVGRLFGVWCALMLSLPLGIVWLRGDLAPGRAYIATVKLAVLLGIACSGGLVVALAVAPRWLRAWESLTGSLQPFPPAKANCHAKARRKSKASRELCIAW